MDGVFQHEGVGPHAPKWDAALSPFYCVDSRATDASLAQFRDCNELSVLFLDHTEVSDAGLTHLKRYKNLKLLRLVNTKVSDLLPLHGMSLEEIRVTPNRITKRGLDILRNMKSLKTIGSDVHHQLAWPPAEFWARYVKGEFKK